jgi:hypothetical protein
MLAALRAAGFSQVRRCEFGDSGDPMFRLVSRKLGFKPMSLQSLYWKLTDTVELAESRQRQGSRLRHKTMGLLRV